MNTYEGVFFLSDTLKAEELENAIQSVKSAIEKAGGVIHSATEASRRAFARPLKRETGGFHMQLDFDLAPDKVDALKKSYRLDSNIVRIMIVRARTDTVAK